MGHEGQNKVGRIWQFLANPIEMKAIAEGAASAAQAKAGEKLQMSDKVYITRGDAKAFLGGGWLYYYDVDKRPSDAMIYEVSTHSSKKAQPLFKIRKHTSVEAICASANCCSKG